MKLFKRNRFQARVYSSTEKYACGSCRKRLILHMLLHDALAQHRSLHHITKPNEQKHQEEEDTICSGWNHRRVQFDHSNIHNLSHHRTLLLIVRNIHINLYLRIDTPHRFSRRKEVYGVIPGSMEANLRPQQQTLDIPCC